LEIFKVCTGRTLDPRTNFGTVVVIAGARAGKDSRFVAPTALYEAEFGGHVIAKGETATIALYAQDKDAAGVTFGYISDYVTESPTLRKRLVGLPLRRSVRLSNGFVIHTFPATRTAGRAYSFPVVCLNESAFYRFEGAANADVEILTSVRRGMLNFPRRKLLIVSTPYAKGGILYDHYQRFFGRDESKDVLVWRAPSAYMNPSISAERLAEEQRTMDPSRFAREFMAEFIDDAAAWLPGDLIEQVVDVGVVERPPKPGLKYVMGTGSCAFAVTIGHLEEQGDVDVAVQDVMRPFMKPASGKLNLKGVVREALILAANYNQIAFAYSDRYAGAWPVQAFEEVAAEMGMTFTLKDPVIQRGKETVALDLLLAQGGLERGDRSSPTARRTNCSVVYGIALARALRPVSDRRRATAAPHRRRGHAYVVKGARQRQEHDDGLRCQDLRRLVQARIAARRFRLTRRSPSGMVAPIPQGSFPSRTGREGESTFPSPTQAGQSASA
jgi:hypothetical protein